MRGDDIDHADMFIDHRRILPGPDTAGQRFGHMQRARRIGFDQIEIGVLARLADAHHHIRGLGLKLVQSAVDVFGDPQGRGAVKIQKSRDRATQGFGRLQRVLPDTPFGGRVGCQMRGTQADSQGAARNRMIIDHLVIRGHHHRPDARVGEQLVQRPVDERFATEHSEVLSRNALGSFARTNMPQNHGVLRLCSSAV